MTREQLVSTAISVLEEQGVSRSIFLDVNAFSLGGAQSVGAQVSAFYELPDKSTMQKAKQEFLRATGGVCLNIY